MPDKDKPLSVEENTQILTNHVAVIAAKYDELLERATASPARLPTLSEMRAATRKKHANYHADARAGRVERYRSPTRTDREEAERATREKADDDAA